MGLKAFRKIQISSVEDTPGSAEAATEILHGTMGTWEDENELYIPEEDRASLALNFEDAEFVSEKATAVWEGDVNFRDILYALLMSIRGNITPTQPDPTNEPLSYLWTITPGITTANTPDITNGIDTFTIEYGDDTAVREMAYCFGTSLEISGAPNEPCKFTLDITGDKQTISSFTESLTATAVQLAPFNKAQFYLDAAGGTMGDTPVTGLLRGFTWRLDTKLAAFYCADGSLSYGTLSEGRKAVELDLTYKYGTAAQAEYVFYAAQTTRLMRIKLNGTVEQDSAQANPPYLCLDQAVRYANWPTWGDDEGASTFEVTAYGVYNADYAKMFEAALFCLIDEIT